MATAGVTAAVTFGGFLATPAVQAQEDDPASIANPAHSTQLAEANPTEGTESDHAESQASQTTQTFDGDYVVVGGASMFVGNCFNARNINIDSRRYQDCGVERAALNITGDVMTEYHREHLFLGNDWEVRGGTIALNGGVYEGNNFVANTIIIRGNALFVGRNTFEGEVFVKDPDQIAGEVFFLDEITTQHVDTIGNRVDTLLNCTNQLLEPQAFGLLDTEGEYAVPTIDGEVGIHNLVAAANQTDEIGQCAQVLSDNHYAHYSAIATVDGPRNATAPNAITHAEIELFDRELRECRDQMNAARPQSPGAAVGALLDCGESMLTAPKDQHQ
ncbi:hypothetical protein ACIBFB_25495 [Nocardiopsis sp. NPDC050513]|uniref:hypothetical protein n=1 Tax=Nocardiopsis sp. NPDC050513 TaxID=3364338 RepID=UPI0037A8F1C8